MGRAVGCGVGRGVSGTLGPGFGAAGGPGEAGCECANVPAGVVPALAPAAAAKENDGDAKRGVGGGLA